MMTEPTELVEQIARKAAAHFDLTCRGGRPIETLADLSSAEMDVGSVDCLLFARAIIPIARTHDAARVAELEDVLERLSDAAATAVHFKHQDTNAMLVLETEMKAARRALRSNTDG